MKNKLCALLLCLPMLPLFALRSGDKVEELTGIKWLNGGPFRMYFHGAGEQKPEYRAVVFMLTHTANSSGTLRMLDDLVRRSNGLIRISVVTPDPESDAGRLLANVRGISLPFGIDRDRKLTARYMAGSMLYPMAFVAAPGGKIVWNGEAVDLPELLENAGKTPIDGKKQQKISALLDELQVMMRGNDNRRMRIVADRIFRLDPGNAAALRMRLFVLESSGRIMEAWNLVSDQLEEVPGKARLYYTALDLMARYPFLGSKMGSVIHSFRKNIKDPESYDLMVWTLLNRFDFNGQAFSGAVLLYRDCVRISSRLRRSARALAGHASSGAVLAARTGDLSGAIQKQKQAVAHWRAANDHEAAAAAEKVLKYFILCSKTKLK